MKADEIRTRFGITFSMLARRWNTAMNSELAKSGLTATTWIPLIHLRECPEGIVQKALAARVGVDTSSLVRVLDILERDGLVERRPDETDGRAKLIHLTEYGNLQVNDILHEIYQTEELMLSVISTEEITLMVTSFEKINRRMSEIFTDTN